MSTLSLGSPGSPGPLSGPGSSLVRHGVCLALGVAAALGLFLLMQGMISRGEMDHQLQRRVPLPNFIRMDQPDEIVRQRQREEPKPLEKPEPLPRMEAMSTPKPPNPQTPTIDPNMPDIRPDLALAGLPMAAAMTGVTSAADDGPVHYTQSLTPVSQIPPRYPRRAQLDGISGWVRLEFIVNPDGSVGEVTVVEANPRRGIFDQEAVRALSRWRFQPQTRDGVAVPALATIVINFTLEN
ncbi:energy transducer TonB [Desulfonatronum parangueonense]